MPPTEPSLDPVAVELLRRMTAPQHPDPSVFATEIAVTQIDPLALGDLWATAQSIELCNDGKPVQSLAADTARDIIALGRKQQPILRGSACRDVLDRLARLAEEDRASGSSLRAISLWSEACSALSSCTDLSFAGLAAAARRFLATSDQRRFPHAALALARLMGAEFARQAIDERAGEWSGSPLLVGELRVAVDLDLAKHISLATAIAGEQAGAAPDGEHSATLADEPAYAAFAAEGVKAAVRRVRDIHTGAVPYAADKAFTVQESAVIARLVRVGLSRDDPWMPALLDDLFRKVAVAPNSAKTMPSQSVAIALGHAVEAFPTPEAVTTLREVVRETRHAGVKKKLDRNLRGAQRRLANRPEIALRCKLDMPFAAACLKTMIRSLEASFASGLVLSHDEWRARAADHPLAGSVHAALVWRLLDANGDSRSILPIRQDGRLTLSDVNGATVAVRSNCRVTLWHPADVLANERTEWRDRITSSRIKQPFKQVFREHYAVQLPEQMKNETALFAGHVISGIAFAGLARREGWRLGDAVIERLFGRLVARFALTDVVYPGSTQAMRTQGLSLWTSSEGEPRPVPFGDLPPAIASEILRAVDLLVSVSGFGVEAGHGDPRRDSRLRFLAQRPLGGLPEMRKQAIRCALRGLDGMADAELGTRHLHLGPYAIHLATGRVTRGGEQITFERPKRSNLSAVPWLPYDEKLLEMIVFSAVKVAELRKADPARFQDGNG